MLRRSKGVYDEVNLITVSEKPEQSSCKVNQLTTPKKKKGGNWHELHRCSWPQQNARTSIPTRLAVPDDHINTHCRGRHMYVPLSQAKENVLLAYVSLKPWESSTLTEPHSASTQQNSAR